MNSNCINQNKHNISNESGNASGYLKEPKQVALEMTVIDNANELDEAIEINKD